MPLETDNVWSRIKTALELDTVTEVADKLALTKQAVYEWPKGKMPGIDTLVKISEIGNVSLHWLLTGEGEKDISPLQKTALEDIALQFFNSINIPSDARAILNRFIRSGNLEKELTERILESIYRRYMKADGIGLIFFGQYASGLMPVKLVGDISDEKIFELSNKTVLIANDFERAVGEKFALRVRGEGMSADDIHSGDLIVFTKSSKAKSGDTVIALIDDQRTVIKRFSRTFDKVRLFSISERRKPQAIEANKIKILGRVVGIQRNVVFPDTLQ